MGNTIERTKNGLDTAIDRTRDVVVAMADRTETGVEAAADRMADGAHVAGDFVRAGAVNASLGAHRHVENAAKELDRRYIQTRGDLSRAATAVTDYVTDNPGKSMLLVATASFALGVLVRRQRLVAC